MALEMEERAIQKSRMEAARMKRPQFHNLPEVAEILRVSVETVRRRIRAGQLRSFKEGGRVLVLESDLIEYLQRQYGGPLNA